MRKRDGIAVALFYRIRWWCESGKTRLSGGILHWDVIVGAGERVDYEKNINTAAKDQLLMRLRARRFRTSEYDSLELWKELSENEEADLPDRGGSTIPCAGNG